MPTLSVTYPSSSIKAITWQQQNCCFYCISPGSHTTWSFIYAKSLLWAGTRDLLEPLTEFKGFEQSSEAGDIFLGEIRKRTNELPVMGKMGPRLVHRLPQFRCHL